MGRPPQAASTSSRSAFDLLHQPTVAVRVAEREEAVVVAALRVRTGNLPSLLEVEELTNLCPVTEEICLCRLDITNNEV